MRWLPPVRTAAAESSVMELKPRGGSIAARIVRGTRESGAHAIAPSWSESYYAGEENNRAGAKSQAGGKGPYNSGGRIRARRDGTYTRRQTRRTLARAGHCHRSVEGAARRR